ncbi:MAG: shikimate dehydrogenase [Fulvivirga sp.]|uniref:shikimate dehydrogenase family protein n=1 Tax=Fulvivirga sp. TaxID=1931237 RepID=UPI0032EB0EDD
MRQFGLIGKKLSHSFSKNYFTEKFNLLGLDDHSYELFELSSIEQIKAVFETKNIEGLNVTVPYKEDVIPYLDGLDQSAEKVKAVNVIKITNGKNVGYNSDYIGFKNSLNNWLPQQYQGTALILGTGGASKAVSCALSDLKIPYTFVSRKPTANEISYQEASSLLPQAHLIINTTPLGMAPDTNTCPDLDFNQITSEHYLYDLVYNPEETLFLAKGKSKGASIKNGLEMLHLQAEESWKIWNK